MIPGSALGVLVGDVAYTWLAVRLARRDGREDVTAMPFGIDTPTLFAMVFGVLGPVMVATHDPELAWKVGMAVTVAIGVIKTALAFVGDWVRTIIPRAALLGSIGGIAILLIAFLPALRIFADPLIGVTALTVLFLALYGRVRMPFGVPGALAAVAAGGVVFWARAWIQGTSALPPVQLQLAIPWPTLGWVDAIPAALPYLSIALPFALVTIVGGIDNSESARAAGDDYRPRDILLTEALATILAGTTGGVVQNTPYIGHPAYKAMGARAGYTLGTGLVIGGGAMIGMLALIVGALPEAAVAPILVFVGLEITAQAFLASPRAHGAAVAITIVPATAALLSLETSTVLGALGRSTADLAGDAASSAHAITMLGNGFVVTALLWGSALVGIVERRFVAAAVAFALAGVAALVGLIHSPLARGAPFWPWAAPSTMPATIAGAYAIAVVLCALAARRTRREG